MKNVWVKLKPSTDSLIALVISSLMMSVVYKCGAQDASNCIQKAMDNMEKEE